MRKICRLGSYQKQAGWIWTTLFGFRYALKGIISKIEAAQVSIEQKRFLTGEWTISAQRNTRAWNADFWNQWDWSRQGEEWTIDETWKNSLVDNVLRKYITPNSIILEIGPGAGRWTEFLQPLARGLTLCDVSEKCLELCRIRFRESKNIRYHWTDGRHLDFLPDASIDHVWSYDCFVHINPTDTNYYLVELARVLAPGGRAIIHHPGTHYRDANVRARLIRSDTTAEFFARLVKDNGLLLEEQLESQAHMPGDVISIFSRPK